MENGKAISNAADKFHRDTVRHWNPHANEVTMTNNLRLVEMSEAASPETASIALELACRFGLITLTVVDGKRRWGLSKYFDRKRMIFMGDVKTVDNKDLIHKLLSQLRVVLLTADRARGMLAATAKNDGAALPCRRQPSRP